MFQKYLIIIKYIDIRRFFAGTYERYLPSICEQLCRKEGKIQLERQHIQALVAALNTTNASLAWKLLSYLCNHIKVDLTAFDASHHEL